MLRHLLTSTARMSSRSLFAKPNASAYVSSRHPFSDQKDDQKGPASPTTSTSTPVDAAGQTVKKPEQFEAGICLLNDAGKRVTLACTPGCADPFARGHPDFGLLVVAHFDVPTHVGADSNQICDWLKLQGIEVERSEKGAQRGLIEYALKQMANRLKSGEAGIEMDCDTHKLDGLNGLRPHDRALAVLLGLVQVFLATMIAYLAYKMITLSTGMHVKYGPVHAGSRAVNLGEHPWTECYLSISSLGGLRTLWTGAHCVLDGSIHVKLPELVAKADYNEICDVLEREGIHVERSEKGARFGLMQLAFKQLHESFRDEKIITTAV